MSSRPDTLSPVRRLLQPWPSLVFAALWLLAFGMLQWSVVRFRVAIVLSLTAAACGLGLWLWRRGTVRLSALLVAAMLLVTTSVWLTVPMFSYVRGGAHTAAVAVLVVGAALVCGVVLSPLRDRAWAPGAGAAAAATAYAVTSSVATVGDRSPRIDVWVSLQQASDGLLHGQNMYAMTWVGSPGVKDAFTYLPWTAVLLAPGRWVLGDVRWMLLLWMLVGLAGVWLLGARLGPRHQDGRWAAAYAVVLVTLAPGTLTQVDQAWTEPMLFAAVVWWAVLVRSDKAWLAVVPLALVCASKQHLALLLPVLLVWRPFGVARTLATGALAGALVAPWFVAGPADFLHDTVTLLIGFHPIRFANTWYLLFLNKLGVTLPFWVTGLIVLAALGCAVAVVRRRQPDLGELLRWLAMVLLVANLVNKQAFYNQFWLSGALVALSLAVPRVTASERVRERLRASHA